MLIKEPNPRVQHYSISLTEDERAEIRKIKKNVSPITKRFDPLEELKKIKERKVHHWNYSSDRPRRNRYL